MCCDDVVSLFLLSELVAIVLAQFLLFHAQ